MPPLRSAETGCKADPSFYQTRSPADCRDEQSDREHTNKEPAISTQESQNVADRLARNADRRAEESDLQPAVVILLVVLLFVIVHPFSPCLHNRRRLSQITACTTDRKCRLPFFHGISPTPVPNSLPSSIRIAIRLVVVLPRSRRIRLSSPVAAAPVSSMYS